MTNAQLKAKRFNELVKWLATCSSNAGLVIATTAFIQPVINQTAPNPLQLLFVFWAFILYILGGFALTFTMDETR